MSVIAILVDKNPYTSFGRMALQFQKALRSRNHQAEIIWLSSNKYFPQGPPHEPFVVHSPSFIQGFFRFGSGVSPLLKKIQPDHVLIIRPELSFLISSIRKANPITQIAVMIHDTFAETLYKNSLKFRLINRFYISPITSLHTFLFNSEYTRHEAHKYWSLKGKEVLCGCVIDPLEFYPLSESKSELRKKLNLPLSKKIFLNISLDEPRKNIQTFLELARKMPDALFLRVGPWSESMQGFVETHQCTNIIHRQSLSHSDLLCLYNCVDALIFTSLFEGFGMPPLEALSCQTPVISSGTSAMAEILKGICPLTDNPQDLCFYESEILRLAEFDQRFPRSEIQKRLQEFSPESFAEKLRSWIP
jgi:glycosyltransferase involved in cell wall biosynthesis